MTKTNIRKRAISILLILMVMLTMTPMAASAAETWVTVNSYAELQTAVKNKQEYIKLGQDIDTKDFHYSGGGLDIADWLTFEGQTCTLDLNGKTLSLMTKIGSMPTFIRVYYGSNLTIKDSQGGGQITGEFENTGAGDRYLIHMNQSSLTLEGGTFRATAKPYGTNVNVIDYLESNVTIKDGVTISQPEHYAYGGGASDLEGHGYALCEQEREFNYGDEVSHVVIDGGIFDGWVRLIGYPDTNGSVQINGGTFKKGVQVLYIEKKNNSAPAVAVNGGTFEGTVYLKYWPWKESLYMPYRLNGGTFKGKLDLHADYRITVYNKPEGNPNIALGLDKCFGYSAVVTPDGTFAGPNAYTAVLEKTDDYDYEMWLKGTASNPVRIIPNAWGMKSVKLDGTEINYAKDWNGGFEELYNDKAHTLKFEWYPLAQELKDAGYSYRTKCEHYISGSTAVQQTDTIAADKTSHTITIPAGVDPKVYSFALHLNLQKNGSSVGIYSNEHIVKLVVNEAPGAPPALTGQVYYTSGIVYDRLISTGTGNLPAGFDRNKLRYQWQRRTDGGEWTDIANATSGSYTPVAADMGDTVHIRVKITAEGYLGEIVGAAVKVSKAANDNTPAPPAVEAQKDDSGAYTKFVISEFNSSNQEYVYTTSAPTSGSEWPTGGTEITSATVKNLTAGSTYYIYTRYKESDTHTAGSKISSSSVLLDEITKLNRIILTDASGKVYSSYGNGNTIYIQRGTSMTLNVTKNPVGANKWSAFTFKSQYDVSAPFTVTAPTGSVASGAEISKVTIQGNTVGTGTLAAEYSGYPAPQSYGTWRVHVYENISDIGTGAEITVSSTFADATMHPGETMTLPAYTVTANPEGALADYHYEWYVRESATSAGSMGSGNNVKENTYLKVNDDGTITAKAVHTGSEDSQYKMVLLCAVKGEYDKTKLASFNVTVTEAPPIALTGITVAPTKVNLEIGKKIQLSAVKEPVNADGSTPTWASDTPAVATVDSTTGEVTAVAKGEATITATCGSKSASCTVTVGHTHDYTGRPYLYLDPGNHYQECKETDGGLNIEAHNFSTWTKVDGTNHSRTCSKCDAIGKSTKYSETAAHTWVWVVDTPAAAGVAGKKHEECTGCNATRKVGTVIPALPNHAASGGGSYAPTTQKPEITIIGSGKADLSADGKTATITAAAGYELASVVLNGKEMGKVEKLTGLKTGDKATITFRAKAGEKDGKEETDKMIAREVSKLRLTARSARTAKKNVKLVVKSDLEAITDAGYTVKYKFYRSTKKSAGYKAVLTKKAPTYVNTYGKKGTLYYYKVKVMVYDKDGNLTAQTALKQCKYASRLWTK